MFWIWRGGEEGYDGFTFGNRTDTYNPWSILYFLDEQKFSTYWANTSSNSLVGKLIREGNKDIISGGVFHTRIDERIVFNQLDHNEYVIWSFLLASSYLKVETYTLEDGIAEVERFYHGFVLGLMVDLLETVK